MRHINPIKWAVIVYKVDDKGHYKVVSRPFSLLDYPERFRIEKIRNLEIFVNAEVLVRGHDGNKWNSRILTGLRQEIDHWYSGDKNRKDTIVFNFSDDKSICSVYVAKNWYAKNLLHRKKVILDLITKKGRGK